jgi:hypothetical protein
MAGLVNCELTDWHCKSTEVQPLTQFAPKPSFFKKNWTNLIRKIRTPDNNQQTDVDVRPNLFDQKGGQFVLQPTVFLTLASLPISPDAEEVRPALVGKLETQCPEKHHGPIEAEKEDYTVVAATLRSSTVPLPCEQKVLSFLWPTQRHGHGARQYAMVSSAVALSWPKISQNIWAL